MVSIEKKKGEQGEMQITAQDYVSPTTVRACVDRVADKEIFGKLISPYAQSPMPFGGIFDMVSKVDGFLTECGYPQAYNRLRSFSPPGEAPKKRAEEKELIQLMGSDVFETKLGEKLTFVIQVQFRQNATWQGTITWAEQNKTQHFRSTMEMIKLMDSAVEQQSSSKFADWEDEAGVQQ